VIERQLPAYICAGLGIIFAWAGTNAMHARVSRLRVACSWISNCHDLPRAACEPDLAAASISLDTRAPTGDRRGHCCNNPPAEPHPPTRPQLYWLDRAKTERHRAIVRRRRRRRRLRPHTRSGRVATGAVAVAGAAAAAGRTVAVATTGGNRVFCQMQWAAWA
jgi:hypothetical protein